RHNGLPPACVSQLTEKEACMELPTLDTLNLAATVPIVFLTGWALLLLVVDLFIPASRKHWSGWLAILGLVAAGVGLVLQTANVLGPELPAEAFFGMAVVDGFAVYAQIIVVVAAIFGILLALEYLPKRRLSRGEYYTLLLFSTIGMMLMRSEERRVGKEGRCRTTT